jgi:hypothetical protein
MEKIERIASRHDGKLAKSEIIRSGKPSNPSNIKDKHSVKLKAATLVTLITVSSKSYNYNNHKNSNNPTNSDNPNYHKDKQNVNLLQ